MRRFIAGFLATLMTCTASVSAKVQLPPGREAQWAENNILFYNPGCEERPGSNFPSDFTPGTVPGTAAGSNGLSGQQVAFVEQYHDIAVELSIKYGIPWETVVAQGILESASGTSSYARNRNNFFGIGAFDSNPDNAFRYATPEEGWEGYYRNIVRTSTYRNHGVFAGDTVTDPHAYLVAIKAAGYATADHYVSSVGSIVTSIQNLSKDRGWESSAELAEKYPEWYENAEINRQGVDANMSQIGYAPSSYTEDNAYYCDGNEYVDPASGELISGGMTLEEAIAFMGPYRAIRPRNYHEPGGDLLGRWHINDVKGCQSDLENCVAFVQYFICEYAGVCMGLPNGGQVVSTLLASGRGFIDGGRIPRPYAIFSNATHTGVVLGVDEANNKIIIGEAGCGASYAWTNAHEYSLSAWTNTSYRYAYTDNLIRF